jgi:endonuclease/exonuclease/phosphatase family metal-dependent hydrolase
MRLLSYNILHGGRGREAAIAEVIRSVDPDLVILQEAERPDAVDRIADLAGMQQFGARRGESLGFISRERVAHAEWHKPRVSRHAFLEIVPADGNWRVFGVHLSAVHAAWTEQRRVFELRALVGAIDVAQHGPHVLVGDFNTLAPGEVLDFGRLPARLRTLVWLSGGNIRWRTIQTVLDAGYRDAFRHIGPDAVGNTFPTWDPYVRLDYLFLPADLLPRVSRCEVVHTGPARDASDHLPLLAELSGPTS